MIAWDDLSCYAERKVLDAANSLNVAKFLHEDVVC